MANIPVERTKSGIPPWLWILGLLLLGLLLWFLISALSDDDEVVVDDTTEEVVAPVAAALDLSNVYVTRVVSDNAFFVAPTPGGTDETLVYLEEEATPGTPTEGRYDVTEGQHLSINGTMEPTPADLTAWGLSSSEASTVGDQYVRATSLTVLDGAAAGDGTMDDGDMGDGAMASDASPLAGTLTVGQSIALNNVRVTGLAGDSTFYVGDGAERTLVVLENLGESQSGPGDGEDGAFDVNTGDMVNINGTVRSFAREMRGASTMSDADRTAAEARRVVIVVDGRGQFSKQ